MTVNMFRCPLVVSGLDAAETVGRHSLPYGKKALIVTDSRLVEAGLLDGISRSLADAKIDFVVFDNVTTEPLMEYAEAGLSASKENHCDFLISVGGGSCIDTAKGISVLSGNPGRLPDYEGLNKVEKPGMPHLAIPTTAGTGSEVSPTTIITDSARNVKMVIMSPHIATRAALVDPLMTVQMPQGVTASTGMDALTHAIEGYVSVRAQSITDALNLHAIELIAQNLPRAWSDGTNIDARARMMTGSLEAGIGFCNSSVALVHGMARPLGVYFHTPHGIANAVLLPAVMEFTLWGNPQKFARIAKALGENTDGLSVMDAAYLSVKAVKRLADGIGIPSIRGLGVSETDFEQKVDQMSQDALVGGSAGFNPRKAVPAEILKIYRKAF